MRELTKSLFSFSWAISLFGIQQVSNLFTPNDRNQPVGKATQAFDELTRATMDQLGSALESTFKAGDNIQRGLVGMFFSFLQPVTWTGQVRQTDSASDHTRRPRRTSRKRADETVASKVGKAETPGSYADPSSSRVN